jgi:hypothetical protein
MLSVDFVECVELEDKDELRFRELLSCDDDDTRVSEDG